MSALRHTILVVDDEPEVVESLKRALRNEPFAVIGTTSPTEALGVVDRGGVDLVIADIDMPEMDGLSLVARIRRSHPDVIRILLTGDASLDSAMAAINEGEVYRYLTKPWDTGELRRIVSSGLQRAEELRSASRASGNVESRNTLLLELEREHPGFRRTSRDDGAYVIDVPRIRDIARTLRDEDLRALFDTEATPGPRRDGRTTRSRE